MDRKYAIDLIKDEYAKHGQATKECVRARIEARISRKTFEKAALAGYAIYKRLNLF